MSSILSLKMIHTCVGPTLFELKITDESFICFEPNWHVVSKIVQSLAKGLLLVRQVGNKINSLKKSKSIWRAMLQLISIFTCDFGLQKIINKGPKD